MVVNVHHFAEQIEEFLFKNHFLEEDVVISDERELLLDTGGGLLKARSLFTPGESVLIHNVDILSDLNLRQLIGFHQQNHYVATLVVRPSVPGRGLRFNEAGWLKGWENSCTGETKRVDAEFETAHNYSFCGIHIVSPELLKQMIHRGVFSIIDEYLAQQGYAVEDVFLRWFFLRFRYSRSYYSGRKMFTGLVGNCCNMA
ncbi:MAG: nucleotidyltransferase family protein [Odoribacter sp.]